jgi:hypothetical protein
MTTATTATATATTTTATTATTTAAPAIYSLDAEFRARIAAATSLDALDALAVEIRRAVPAASPTREYLRRPWSARRDVVLAEVRAATAARLVAWWSGWGLLGLAIATRRAIAGARTLDELRGVAARLAAAYPALDAPIRVALRPEYQRRQDGLRHTAPAGEQVAAVGAVRTAYVAAVTSDAVAAVRGGADTVTAALALRIVGAADTADAWWEIGWSGSGSIARGDLMRALGEAPDPKAPSTQLARAVDTLRGRWDASQVTAGLPPGVIRRWQIGRGQAHTARLGGEYGTVLAVIDLDRRGNLACEGQPDIVGAVRGEYHARLDAEVLQAGDVTAWLGGVLRERFGATRAGSNYLVPPQHKVGARALCTRLRTAWGAHWVLGGMTPDGPSLGRSISDVASIIGALWQGTADEIAEVAALWERTAEEAGTRGAPVGPAACRTALARLEGTAAEPGLADRVRAFARTAGAGVARALITRANALHAAVQEELARTDGTVIRALMIEID